ncbi:MAG TPA: hypothetical protein VGX03_24080 [Candidatus Binatia bacterium]|jgi:hypothetical protein|nr:hypothetical protein [Candidatus Binatia bacterium]
MEKELLALDRTAFSVTSLQEQEAEEKQYWRNKTPYERLQAVEAIRQIVYGYDPTSTRLQRVFEVAERA